MKKSHLVLLPGLLEDADAFAHQIAGLAEVADIAVADLTRSDTMAGLARDVLAQAPAGKFALAGHSMGGYVALEVARQAPERIEALALLNTNARPDSAESTENRRRLMALAERDFDAAVGALLERQLAPSHAGDPTITATITQMAKSIGREAFVRQQNAIIGRIDSRPHLARIRARTLVLAGRDDAIMPLEVLEEMARAIAGSRLEVVEDCGHMATLEQPEAVTGALQLWLGGEPAKGRDVVGGPNRAAPP